MTESIEESSPVDGKVRLTITPTSDFYAENDQRTRDEAFELIEAIRRELPDEVEARPVPGEKGIITDLVIPLVPVAGPALTAAVAVFKAWIAKRPTNRTIVLEFEIDRGGDQKSSGKLRLDATNVDSAVLDTIAKEVLSSGK